MAGVSTVPSPPLQDSGGRSRTEKAEERAAGTPRRAPALGPGLDVLRALPLAHADLARGAARRGVVSKNGERNGGEEEEEVEEEEEEEEEEEKDEEEGGRT